MKYRFKLIGIHQPKFKSMFDTRISTFEKKESEVFHEIEINSDLTLQEIKIKKYDFVPYWINRRLIEEMYDIKIPLWIKKLKWKIEEINEEESMSG